MLESDPSSPDPRPSWTRTFTIRTTTLSAVALLSSLIMACGTIGGTSETREFWSPFNTQSAWDVGDGRVRIELSGFERGHEPGRTAEFTLEIENRRESPAELAICAKLIDEIQIVQQFDKFNLNVQPGATIRTRFEAEFDPEILPRAYGLALVVGDFGAVVHTVRVGIPDDDAGPWLDADELVCD